MATTTATITLSSTDLLSDELALSTTSTLTTAGTSTGVTQATGLSRKTLTYGGSVYYIFFPTFTVRFFIINNIMHTFIHGHKCNHELISDVDYSLEAYDMLLNSSFGLTLAWAVHPFSKHYSILDYHTVCEEFNRDIEWVIHPWNNYSVEQLWLVCSSFNWSAHVASVGTADILHPDYVYTKWYENIFKPHYSYDEWLVLTHTA